MHICITTGMSANLLHYISLLAVITSAQANESHKKWQEPGTILYTLVNVALGLAGLCLALPEFPLGTKDWWTYLTETKLRVPELVYFFFFFFSSGLIRSRLYT